MGLWEKKVEANRGRKIDRVIANDCCFYCSLALRHSRGSDRYNLFLCKSPFRGSLSNSFSTTSLPSLLLWGSFLNFSTQSHSRSSSRTHLLLILITHSFTVIFQEDKGPCDWGSKQSSQGVEGAWVLEREEPFAAICSTGLCLGFLRQCTLTGDILRACNEVIFRVSQGYVPAGAWQKECVPVRKCCKQGIPHIDRAFLTPTRGIQWNWTAQMSNVQKRKKRKKETIPRGFVYNSYVK